MILSNLVVNLPRNENPVKTTGKIPFGRCEIEQVAPAMIQISRLKSFQVMAIQVIPAKPSDLDAVFTLLAEVRLPTEGVSQHFADFLVVLDDERVVGCVGLEKYGEHALLRSLAVAPDWRGKGIGLQLTTQAISYAQANATRKIILLTTSAAEFFAEHFGFAPTERSQFNDVLSTSSEWNLTVCASAVCLVLSLR